MLDTMRSVEAPNPHVGALGALWRPVVRVWGAPIRLSARGLSVEGALISSIVGIVPAVTMFPIWAEFPWTGLR